MNCKRILSVFLILILTFGMCSTAFAIDDIPDGYTPIYTAEDLNNIRNNLSGKYILMNDIDLSSYKNWEPIGTIGTPFTGEFDGNNFLIKSLSLKIDINSDETTNLGLFGFIKLASLSRINVDDLQININYPYNSTFFVGGIAAYCFDSKIELCKVSGNINIVSGGNIYTGGIAGCINDIDVRTEVNKCVSKVEINILGENNDFWQPEAVQYTNVGGIAGYVVSAKSIYKCANEADITVDSINSGTVGSIAGKCDADIMVKCKNSGEVTALGTCELNETSICNTIWEDILSFFVSLFNRMISLFK